MFNHAECRIDKWHITKTSHTRHGISTHWQLYCLFNSSSRETWKKTSSPPFVRGIHQRWNRRALDHQSSTPVIPCNGNPLVTSVSPHTGPVNVIYYGMTNYITVTYNLSFMSFWLTRTSTVCSTARLDKHESRHHSFASLCEEDLLGTPHTGPTIRKPLIKYQRSTSNTKITN